MEHLFHVVGSCKRIGCEYTHSARTHACTHRIERDMEAGVGCATVGGGLERDIGVAVGERHGYSS